MALIAVDFDDTLISFDSDGLPVLKDGARESMQTIFEQGHRIIIYSARPGVARAEGGEEAVKKELEWMHEVLTNFQIPFDGIYNGDKFVADIYIDDRAIEFKDNWQAVLKQVTDREKMRSSSSSDPV